MTRGYSISELFRNLPSIERYAGKHMGISEISPELMTKNTQRTLYWEESDPIVFLNELGLELASVSFTDGYQESRGRLEKQLTWYQWLLRFISLDYYFPYHPNRVGEETVEEALLRIGRKAEWVRYIVTMEYRAGDICPGYTHFYVVPKGHSASEWVKIDRIPRKKVLEKEREEFERKIIDIDSLHGFTSS